MQCPTCLETTVTAFCRECGKGVCRECAKDYQGVPHCPECHERLSMTATSAEVDLPAADLDTDVPKAAPPPPPPPRPARPRHANPDAPHPGIAGVLGLVPGLGAVYNGQYVKGVLHALLFSMCIAIAAGTEIGPAFAPVVAILYLYMPIEAFRTAQAMRRGEKVDEMSGLVGAIFQPKSGSPVGGIVITAIGVILLLFTLDIISVRAVAPFWPIIVIAVGVWQLYRAVQFNQDRPGPPSSGVVSAYEPEREREEVA